MDGPRRRAGGRSPRWRGSRTRARLAHRVMRDNAAPSAGGPGGRRISRSACGFRRRGSADPAGRAGLWIEWRRRVESRRPGASGSPGAMDRYHAGYAVGLEMSREGLIDANHLWGDDQRQCGGAARRSLRCDDDERPGLEDSRPHRRLADPRRGPLRAAGRRRRRIDRARASRRSTTCRRSRSSRRCAAARIRKDAGDGRACARSPATRSIPRCSTTRGSPNFNVKFYVRQRPPGSAPARPCTAAPRCSTRSAPSTAAELRECDALTERRGCDERSRRERQQRSERQPSRQEKRRSRGRTEEGCSGNIFSVCAPFLCFFLLTQFASVISVAVPSVPSVTVPLRALPSLPASRSMNDASSSIEA